MSRTFQDSVADAETKAVVAFARVVGLPVAEIHNAGPAINGLCVLSAALTPEQEQSAKDAGYTLAVWRMRNAGVGGRFSARGWQ